MQTIHGTQYMEHNALLTITKIFQNKAQEPQEHLAIWVFLRGSPHAPCLPPPLGLLTFCQAALSSSLTAGLAAILSFSALIICSEAVRSSGAGPAATNFIGLLAGFGPTLLRRVGMFSVASADTWGSSRRHRSPPIRHVTLGIPHNTSQHVPQRDATPAEPHLLAGRRRAPYCRGTPARRRRRRRGTYRWICRRRRRTGGSAGPVGRLFCRPDKIGTVQWRRRRQRRRKTAGPGAPPAAAARRPTAASRTGRYCSGPTRR